MLLVAKFPMFQISVKIISYDLFHGHKILVEATVFLKKIKIKPLWPQERKNVMINHSLTVHPKTRIREDTLVKSITEHKLWESYYCNFDIKYLMSKYNV